MKPGKSSTWQASLLLFGLLVLSANPLAAAEPPIGAVSAFNAYATAFESRLAERFRSSGSPSWIQPKDADRARNGDVVIENITPEASDDLKGAILHHWRGTAFVAGAKAADFERLMKNFSAYPQVYSPQVSDAKVLSQSGSTYQVLMRVRQQHVITVVMDSAYDVRFVRIDVHRGYSISRSTQISEISSPGTPKERPLTPAEDHGFLWRLNTYWTFEERNGGLYLQIESISLTRAIPASLAWAAGPFVESVPRESLEFTLRQTSSALRRKR